MVCLYNNYVVVLPSNKTRSSLTTRSNTYTQTNKYTHNSVSIPTIFTTLGCLCIHSWINLSTGSFFSISDHSFVLFPQCFSLLLFTQIRHYKKYSCQSGNKLSARVITDSLLYSLASSNPAFSSFTLYFFHTQNVNMSKHSSSKDPCRDAWGSTSWGSLW